jgi:hypothetical protein
MDKIKSRRGGWVCTACWADRELGPFGLWWAARLLGRPRRAGKRGFNQLVHQVAGVGRRLDGQTDIGGDKLAACPRRRRSFASLRRRLVATPTLIRLQ